MPLNKGSDFAVMMRKESVTYRNLKERPRMAVAWMPPDRVVAQMVKKTKDPLDPLVFEMGVPQGFSLPVPVVTIHAIEAVVLAIQKMENCVPWTHVMVIGRAEKVLFSKSSLPLLHMNGKTFAIAEEFEVEGY
jgi:hypothetical protein